MADDSAQQSNKELLNKTLITVPKQDLIVQKQSPSKGRRSVSCGSNSSPSFGPDISELNALSFKSDQASIADWLELFEKNEDGIDGEDNENFFDIINKENLLLHECQTIPVELAMMADEDSNLGELNKAFIHEHSEINVQGPSLLDEANTVRNAPSSNQLGEDS